MPFIGPPQTGTNGLYSSNEQAAPYRQYDVRTFFEYDDGSLAIPVAYNTGQPLQSGQRQPQEIVQLSAPRSRRVVRFRIARESALPVAPAPVAQSNENLSYIAVESAAPQILADGVSLLFRMWGVYVFDHRQPVVPGTDTLRSPTTDADTLTPDQIPVTPNQFRSGLI